MITLINGTKQETEPIAYKVGTDLRVDGLPVKDVVVQQDYFTAFKDYCEAVGRSGERLDDFFMFEREYLPNVYPDDGFDGGGIPVVLEEDTALGSKGIEVYVDIPGLSEDLISKSNKLASKYGINAKFVSTYESFGEIRLFIPDELRTENLLNEIEFSELEIMAKNSVEKHEGSELRLCTSGESLNPFYDDVNYYLNIYKIPNLESKQTNDYIANVSEFLKEVINLINS